MDLNALKYFIEVFETQSTSIAANNLGVSPSAVSQNITKLNEFYGERLFIRKSNTLVPSAKAYSLYSSIKPHFEEILTHTSSLKSAQKAKRVISYFSHRDADLLFLPKITSRIEASNYELTLVNLATTSHEEVWHDELIQRQANFVISTQPITHTGFENHVLFEEELVVVSRVGHPKAELLTDKKRFFDFDFVTWSTPKNQRLILDSLHQGALENRHIAYKSDSLLTSLFMVSKSNWVCVVPKWYALELQDQLNLEVYPLPFEPITKLPIYLSFRKQAANDPILSWVLSQLFDLFSQLDIGRQEATKE